MANLDDVKLTLIEGSFQDGMALQRVLTDSLNAKGLSLKENMGGMEIMEIALVVGTDPEVQRILFKLGAESTITTEDGRSHKINEEFFQPVENRKYYIPVMTEIAKKNLTPFFKDLNVQSLIDGLTGENSQK